MSLTYLQSNSESMPAQFFNVLLVRGQRSEGASHVVSALVGSRDRAGPRGRHLRLIDGGLKEPLRTGASGSHEKVTLAVGADMTIGKRPAAKMLPQVTVDEPAQLGPQLQPDCGVQPVFVLAEHATAVPLHMP